MSLGFLRNQYLLFWPLHTVCKPSLIQKKSHILFLPDTDCSIHICNIIQKSFANIFSLSHVLHKYCRWTLVWVNTLHEDTKTIWGPFEITNKSVPLPATQLSVSIRGPVCQLLNQHVWNLRFAELLSVINIQLYHNSRNSHICIRTLLLHCTQIQRTHTTRDRTTSPHMHWHTLVAAFTVLRITP